MRSFELWRRAGWVATLVVLAFAAAPAHAQESAELAVASEPGDASVFIRYADDEDRYVGTTPEGDGPPLELEVGAGPAAVVIFKEGYVAEVEPLELQAGGAARLEVRLTPDVEVPRGLTLHECTRFVGDAREGEEIYLAVLAQVVRFYVEEKDPRALVESSVRTLVDILNAVRARERLLRRELPEAARLRYYGEEVDLREYPALAFRRGEPGEPGGSQRSYTLGAGSIGIEGTTRGGDLDSYLDMLQRVYTFLDHEWDTKHLLTDSMLTECLIEGLLAGLEDRHTAFLGPDEVAEMTVETEGSFGGVGVVVGVKDGQLTVVRPMPGTPGERAGLRSGDRIVAIDGQPTARASLRQAVDLMRGEVDSPVELTVRRGGREFDVSVVRDRVEMRYTARRLFGDVGYLRISSFMHERLHEDVREALDELRREGARALVLDLRNNPGGLLEQARRVADMFVPKGVIVSTQTRIPGESRTLRADPERSKWGVPMRVLINEGSASAAEILAGSLREHGLAELVGQRTYGKGSVQRVMPLEPYGCALSLTVATYHLPSGVTPHGRGVEPDVAVALSEEEALRVAGRSNYTVSGEAVDAQLEEALELLRARLADEQR